MYERSGIFDREGFSRGGCDVRLAPRGSFLVITDRGGATAVRRRVTVRRVRGRAGREEDEVLGMQPATRRGYLHPWQHDHDVAFPPRLFLVQATHRHNPHRRCGASHRRSPEPSPPFPAWTRPSCQLGTMLPLRGVAPRDISTQPRQDRVNSHVWDPRERHGPQRFQLWRLLRSVSARRRRAAALPPPRRAPAVRFLRD